jgi:hypothetical protein
VRDAAVFARLAAEAGFTVTRTPDVAEAPVGQMATSRTTSSGRLSVR